ncbi:MAG: hypothetical protein WCF81_16790 [Roseiarcus sp.]
MKKRWRTRPTWFSTWPFSQPDAVLALLADEDVTTAVFKAPLKKANARNSRQISFIGLQA